MFLSLISLGLFAAAGALLGILVASALNVEINTEVLWLGALGGALAHQILSVVRSSRLAAWARQSIEQRSAAHALPAPVTGVWGEIAYRVEKNYRAYERSIRTEGDRLSFFISAIDASPNGVLLLNAQQEIDWCNRTAALHFALDPVRDRLQAVTNIVRTPEFIAYLREGRFEDAVTFRSSRFAGKLSVLIRPYGEGMLVLSQDITERERAEQMRRDFVANVSHEMRTPLTVVAGFIETLANIPMSEPDRQAMLGMMDSQTQRMQAIVSDLLMLAELESSASPPVDGWVACDALLVRAADTGRGLSAGRHAIEIVSSASCDIAGLESELLSAIDNLVSNACRYTPAGGKIVLGQHAGLTGGVVIEVTDTGPGIPAEHLPRLTERFYRVDSGRSREHGGTGLGLSIVKHVMQRHGGHVGIQSTIGAGSSFSLSFPAARVRVALKPGAALTALAVD